MRLLSPSTSLDHHLIARAQAKADGANAHDVHSLLAAYYGFCELAQSEPHFSDRVEIIERQLRAFCQTGRTSREREYGRDLAA